MNKLFTILILSICTLSYGQYDMDEASDTTAQKEKKVDAFNLKERIYVGGDLSLSFGGSLYLMIQPMAGYEIWGGLSAGPTFMYQYFRQGNVSYNDYGGGIFARWRPPVFPYVIAHTEFDIYSVEGFSPGQREAVPAFYGGLGYAGGVGKAYYSIMLLYDFAADGRNPLPQIFGGLPLYLRYGMVFYLG